jgi:hypothetical protein
MRKGFAIISVVTLTMFVAMRVIFALAEIPPLPMTVEGYVFIKSVVTGENLTAPAGLKIYAKVGTEVIHLVNGSQDITDNAGYYVIGISGPPEGTAIDLWVQEVNVTRIILAYYTTLELNLTVIDTIPPTAPMNLAQTSPLNDTTPAFIWTASTDNLRVEGYYVQITNYPVYWIGNTTSWESPDELPEGNYTLNVWAKDLAGNNGTKASLKFTIRTAPILPPEVTITNPTTTNPVYTRSGTTIQVTYRYTEASPKNATITVYNSTNIIRTETITNLAGGTNITRTDSILIPAGTAEGSYNINVTVYNIYELSSTATQTDAIKVDITAPTITGVSQNPPANNVQPTDTVEVTATVTDALSGVKNVTLYYSKDGGATWNPVPMQPNGQLYKGTIPPLPADTTVKYYIEAFDKAGNKKISPETEYYIYTVIPEFPNILAILLILSATILIAAAIKWRKPSQQPPFL